MLVTGLHHFPINLTKAPVSSGVTPLMASAIAGSANTAKLLLARGAMADSVSARGHTALQAARQLGAGDVALLLEPYTTVNKEGGE